MAVAAEPGNGSRLERVAALIRASGRGGESRAKFARLLFAKAEETDLEAYSPEALAALAISAWEFVGQRKPKHHRLRAFNTDRLGTGHGDVTVIDILNDDMPFLVDSVMGEILERGLTVRFIVHPIFVVSRDANGKLKTVAAARPDTVPPEGSIKESFIHVHVDRIEDEAALEDLKRSLSDILSTVRIVVRDWKPMLERLNRAIATYTNTPPPVPASELSESIQFLKWLADDHFTFLGMRAMAYVGGREGRLEPAPDSGLGILRDPNVAVLRRGTEAVHMTPEIRKFFLAPEPLIITKANVRSTVHRRTHMDYIGVKIYSASGEISGELRIVGLFTSAAYTRSVKSIPFLRHKAETVLGMSGFPPESHSGKSLQNVLDTFPRDELFQIGVNQLYETAIGILNLELKPRTRVFARIDEFDRFVSVLVFVPRDRFSTQTRVRIGEFLAEAYRGRVSAFYPYLPEGPLARVHYIIGRYEGSTPVHDQAYLEERIQAIIRTWEDSLRMLLTERLERPKARQVIARYGAAFPAGYQETVPVERALEDIKRLERLDDKAPVLIDIYRDEPQANDRVRITVYSLEGPIPLSRRVPILENLGFDVIDERSYRITPRLDGQTRLASLHDMVVGARDGATIDIGEQGRRLEECFLAVWRNRAPNDAFNRLVLTAGLTWREAAVLRAYGSYLRQIRAPFGQAYLADTLVRHAGVTRDLMALFKLRFDPDLDKTPEARATEQEAIVQAVETALEAIPSLDEDRIIRHYRNLVCATVRTNFFCRDEAGEPPDVVAFKFDSAAVDAAPAPRPFAEIFVFSTRVEGIHLRGGPIARGGVRWSDRLQDYRTEVLGLAKAQQVKNAVIVPTGAKGGFVPKMLPSGGSREAVQAEAVAAYTVFISQLLALTDNLDGAKVVPPARVVRHDRDDPYLVVAADKGTAAFSDIANSISAAHGFWLGDAFASGGSAGYDHKKMGITARGAWEAVKRHFREMDIDIQTTPFTVIGVGDMSGDVFGNGMLLSKTIRLLAAFDHRDIFIDPDPDPERSWAERKRLFEMPRSSWQDYDKSLISSGGGVFPRTAKAITLSPEMKALTGLEQASVTPAELIRALLRAEADLLWLGGIGTYVKADGETDAEVGDRANDGLRVLASQLRVKVIGEGANLGLTQKARIAFALGGGRLNSDAIDNSAGVNSSDLEVNIKIALTPAVQSGRLDMPARNALLAGMTDEVAAACLRNNYLQSLAISLGERRGLSDLGFQGRLIRELERSGLIDRQVEVLPGRSEIEERRTQGLGLTRPELALLLAYAKIDLRAELVASAVPDDPYFARLLLDYFPRTLRQRFGDDIAMHRLRREIIATQLANTVVNRGGSTIVVRLKEETGRSGADIALAATIASAVFGLEALNAEIDRLDNALPGERQLDLYLRVQDVLRSQTGWFLRHVGPVRTVAGVIDLYHGGQKAIAAALDEVLTEAQRQRLHEDCAALEAIGLAPELGRRLAALPYLADAPDAVHTAEATKRPVEEIAAIFSRVAEYFRIHDLRRAGDRLAISDYFDRLALNSLNGVLSAGMRALVRDVVRRAKADQPAFDAWHGRNRHAADRARQGIDEILEAGDLTLAKLMVAAAHVRDLAPS